MTTFSAHQVTVDRPTRAALVNDTRSADELVAALQGAGIPRERITVVSDSEQVREHFRRVNAQPPAGRRTVGAILLGTTAGLVLGIGGAAMVGLFSDGDRPQLLISALMPFGAAVVGGFVGAMLTRGAETEAANFLDQAALPNQILVAVELADADPAEWLRRADEAIQLHGARSMPLSRG